MLVVIGPDGIFVDYSTVESTSFILQGFNEIRPTKFASINSAKNGNNRYKILIS
jgi:hypothetical protein